VVVHFGFRFYAVIRETVFFGVVIINLPFSYRLNFSVASIKIQISVAACLERNVKDVSEHNQNST